MPRATNRLKDSQVRAAKKRGMYPDGDGLYLQISKFGTKAWIFRYALNKRSRQMGLGKYPTISLGDARQRRDAARKLLTDGIDPIDDRNAERLRRQREAMSSKSFKECAEAYLSAHSERWSNDKHRQQWSNTLRDYAYPTFGELPAAAIETSHVMQALSPIWSEKTETARRVRARVEAVLDWATTMGYREGANPARWKGHLKNLLPDLSRVRSVKHHPALPYEQIGDFMAALRQRESTAARGLEFLILTAGRTGEVIGARWEEFDLERKEWLVPAERMKGKREHRVPLSEAAVTVIKAQADNGSEYVFPGQRRDKHLSNMAQLKLLDRMGHGNVTTHGFRSTFRDWASEQTAFPREVAEKALAHAIPDKVEAAYRRGELMRKRRKLMEAWAGYCARPSEQASNVVALQGGAA